MATMPDETKKKIAEGVRRAYESPAVRKRQRDGTKQSMTPARRAAIGKERREFWRKWREQRKHGPTDATQA